MSILESILVGKVEIDLTIKLKTLIYASKNSVLESSLRLQQVSD